MRLLTSRSGVRASLGAFLLCPHFATSRREVMRRMSVRSAGNDPPRTRTWNLRLRRPTPYPLGQQATWQKARPRTCPRAWARALVAQSLIKRHDSLAREFYARVFFAACLVRVNCARVSLRALVTRAFLRVDFCACLFARAFVRVLLASSRACLSRPRAPRAPRAPRNFSLYPNSFILHMHTLNRGKLN